MGRCGSMGMGQCANGTERGKGVFVSQGPRDRCDAGQTRHSVLYFDRPKYASRVCVTWRQRRTHPPYLVVVVVA